MAWNPWRALRERGHLSLGIAELPAALGGALFVPDGRGGTVLLGRDLTQVERNRALAHELVHDERGGGADAPGMPATWQPVVAKDEQQTDDEAVRRLVPLADLAGWCLGRITTGEPVEPHQVSEEWHVPEDVAARALEIVLRHPTLRARLHDDSG